MKVEGLYLPGISEKDANPDIVDSTITETAGYGSEAMAASPTIVQFVSGTPRMAFNSTLMLTKSPSASMKASLSLCSISAEHHSDLIFVRSWKPELCQRSTPALPARFPGSVASALVSYVPLKKTSRTRLINSVRDFANLF